MRKSVTKIVKVTLGLTMTIGMGLSAAISSGKKANSVVALGKNDCWTQVTSLDGLNTTDKYVIASNAADGEGVDYYFKGTQSSGHLQSAAFGTTAPTSNSAAGVFQLISVDAGNNIYKIKLVSSNKCVTASKAASGGGVVNTSVDDAEGWRFLMSGSNFDAIYQHEYSSKYAALRCSSYTSWRTYANNSDSAISTTYGTDFRIYKYRQLNSIAVSTAPTKVSYSEGEMFDPTGLVITRNYADSTSNTLTYANHTEEFSFSPSLSTGLTAENTSVSITYGGKTTSQSITVSAVLTPYITVSKNSTSGYTTENETLSFTCGNLSSLNIVSSNTSVVTIGTISAGATSGTVVINFVGNGSTTVLFKDGDTQLASVSVSVSTEHGRLESDPLTVAEAVAIGSALGNDNETTKDYYVRGYISQIVSNFSGTPAKARFWLANGESTVKGFEGFDVTLKDGLTTDNYRVGADAIINCTIKKYSSTTIESGSVGEVVSLEYDEIPATSLSLDRNSIGLLVGRSTKLTASVIPVYTTQVIDWVSSDETVATVNQNGNVQGIGIGTAVITATIGGITETCSVNVAREMIDLFNKSYSVATPDSAQTVLSTAEVGDYTLNLLNAYNNAGGYAYMMLGTSALKTNDSLLSNSTPAPGAITKIVFRTTSNSSGKAVCKAVLTGSEVTSPVSDDSHTLNGAGSITITANASDNLRYFAISNTTQAGNAQIESIEINYETTEETVGKLETISGLKFDYSNSAGVYSYSSAAIRFGGFVSEDLWNKLEDIEGYGVVIAPTSSLGGDAIEEKYYAKQEANAADANAENDTVDAILAGVVGDLSGAKKASANNVTPASADASQKEFMGVDAGDNYFVWTSRMNINEANFATEYSAVAYIKIDGDILFLQETSASIKGLAIDRLASMDPSDPGYGAIEYITLHY